MITVVSGLPRSGTSMMMRMLEAGGMGLLVDGVRGADPDNPRGYFELERVKQLRDDTSWLGEAEGRAVKVISMLLYDLPPDRDYRVIFMRRELSEVLRSQAAMLLRRGAPAGPADNAMAAHFLAHLDKLDAWLAGRARVECLDVEYAACVARPLETAARVAGFLAVALDVERMATAVDPTLYRQRVRPLTDRPGQ